MFSKILVGFTALVLLGVGGFIYWDNQNCPSRHGCNRGGNGCSNTVAPCCLQNGEISRSAASEELTVMPREVAEQ